MAAAYSRRSSSGPVMRSLSPSGRFYNSPSYSSSSSAFAYSTSSFSARSSTFFHRSASPTRVNLCGSNKPSQTTSANSVRFVSPNRSNSITSSRNNQILKNQTATKQKRTCMCSPTTHPGSFRCSLHKNFNSSSSSNYSPNNRLDARRSAMKNSLVRIGGVEGDLVKRALASLIRPSSHQQRRRAGFQPRPSRLSIVSKAEDDL
ncbi:hypothetical protein ACOSP7_012338 [Xanthoceras sorbifolium]|uniref:Serine-rich protein-like protein n=1 Tax=Xanthoceras sorbifolium TaxID=99658 RepID=A0ABQ8HXM7_9ROSI|nr:hypothetical protein JRO89_XS06G0108700 [Xanthoceras sorbifolium]